MVNQSTRGPECPKPPAYQSRSNSIKKNHKIRSKNPEATTSSSKPIKRNQKIHKSEQLGNMHQKKLSQNPKNPKISQPPAWSTPFLPQIEGIQHKKRIKTKKSNRNQCQATGHGEIQQKSKGSHRIQPKNQANSETLANRHGFSEGGRREEQPKTATVAGLLARLFGQPTSEREVGARNERAAARGRRAAVERKRRRGWLEQ